MSEEGTTAAPELTLRPTEEAFYQRLGQRIAALRRDRGLTQVQLAKTLGISQQHMLSFEKGRRRMLAGALPAICRALDVSTEDLLSDSTPSAPRKQGPAPRLQRQLERVSRLPRAQQRFVSDFLDTVLQQAGR